MRHTFKVSLLAVVLADAAVASGLLAAPSKPPVQQPELAPLRAAAVFTDPHSQVKDRTVVFATDQAALDQA